MPPFSSKPLPSSSSSRHPFARLVPAIRRSPFLLFGLPFTFTILSAAYGLSYLTQTRYEYNATKVQSLSKEEELGMKKGRRKVDLREEYWRLSGGGGNSSDTNALDAGEDQWSDWEPKRVPRPAGMEEWGVASSSNGVPFAEQQDKTRDYPAKKKRNWLGVVQAEEASPIIAGASGNKTIITSTGERLVIGPDGKPCRACSSRLAFADAMKGAGAGSKGKGKQGPSPFGAMAGAGAAATTAATSSDDDLKCPPDVNELGRSSWDLLHSIAAVYPDNPSESERTALLGLLKALPLLYPCKSCAEALQEEYTSRESRPTSSLPSEHVTVSGAVASKTTAMKFMCGIHNEVNERLGKKKWDCEDLKKLKERWEDGGRKCW